jgi:hypothetical protein
VKGHCEVPVVTVSEIFLIDGGLYFDAALRNARV